MEGLVLASAILVLAGAFAWRQWVERSRRADILSGADRDYYRHRDRRRVLGTTCLVLIASAMIAGSLIDYRASRTSARIFLAIWLGVAVLIGVSLILAMADWMANRAFALRHRRALLAERRALLDDELRRRSAPSNGRGSSLGPPD
jgi:hypothetical protein